MREERVLNEYFCVDCGYGISVRETPEWCPMCLGSDWSVRPWRGLVLDAVALDAPLTRERAAADASVA